MWRWLNRLVVRPTELSIAEAYARWAPCYPPRPHNRLMELEQRAVLAMLPDISGRAALDLACGSGRYLKELLLRGATPAVGLDSSTPMLTLARGVASNLVLADLQSISFLDDTFDVITCALAIGHIRSLPGALLEMSRVLVPGGTVIYSDFHPIGACLGWKRTFRGKDGRIYAVPHYTHFYSDHVAACQAAGLRIEEVREPLVDFEGGRRRCPGVLIIRARKAE